MVTKMSRSDPDPAGSVITWPPGSGPVIQDYGFTNPDLNQISASVLLIFSWYSNKTADLSLISWHTIYGRVNRNKHVPPDPDPIFPIPDLGLTRSRIRIRIKEFVFLTQKTQSSKKNYLGCSSWIPDTDFFHPGSRIRIPDPDPQHCLLYV